MRPLARPLAPVLASLRSAPPSPSCVRPRSGARSHHLPDERAKLVLITIYIVAARVIALSCCSARDGAERKQEVIWAATGAAAAAAAAATAVAAATCHNRRINSIVCVAGRRIGRSGPARNWPGAGLGGARFGLRATTQSRAAPPGRRAPNASPEPGRAHCVGALKLSKFVQTRRRWFFSESAGADAAEARASERESNRGRSPRPRTPKPGQNSRWPLCQILYCGRHFEAPAMAPLAGGRASQ